MSAKALVHSAGGVIQYAAQLGRLDFISALLACIAIILVIAAFPAYLLIRFRAEKIARETAESVRAEILKNVEKLAVKRLEEKLPSLVDDYMALAKNTVTDEIAQAVATAQEGDEHE